MSLTSVNMTEEVWLTCLTHALSSETEEIMGLLLGDIQQSNSGSVTALIWGALPQPRSDRRKDRVETNPEQLTAASVQAERMTVETGKTTRVIGWYHSHPHITVLPSHVDVRTQAMYQLLDSGFIGLIFSCFSEDAQKVGRIQVIAFQSMVGKQSHVLKPVPLAPVHKSSIIDLESSLSSSETSARTSIRGENLEQDTGDSRAITLPSKALLKTSDLGGFFANIDAKTGENFHISPPTDATSEIDHMDMSESMQEAMHLSNMEMSGAEFVRKEIPLLVLPSPSLLNIDTPLSSFTNLQHVLYEEERSAYNHAVTQNLRDGKVHPLTYIHHTSTYQASMCKLIEYCLSPAISALQDRLRENEIQLNMLDDEAKVLESETKRAEEPSDSPRRGGSPLSGHKDLYPPPADLSNTRTSSGNRGRKGS
ncbi:unnamed protein product [Cuscuta epithymum]|uniref:MPN domain-containing protein n=1 Tax=Cuscuta epithymum TaxID=186058 RepID=A0AAV0GGS5_9ASTE|nr:unnamed protein product [Cuscuta epithymum]